MKPIALPELYNKDGKRACTKCGQPSTQQHPVTRVGHGWIHSTECRG